MFKNDTVEISILPDWVTMRECDIGKNGCLTKIVFRDAKEILQLESIATKTGWLAYGAKLFR